MLKADLPNNDSNGVVGFILYLILSSFSSVSLSLFLSFTSFAATKWSGRDVSPSPEPSKFLWPSTRPLCGGGGITVIAAMRSPNITLLTHFMSLFIASSKTLINNVLHTDDCGRVVKSFLYWNFCSFIYPPSHLTFTFTMKINCKNSRLRSKLTLTSNILRLSPANLLYWRFIVQIYSFKIGTSIFKQ